MTLRVAVLGLGAIGRRVLQSLRSSLGQYGEYAALVPSRSAAQVHAGTLLFTDAESLLAWKPQLAIECAGHEMVATVVPGLLGAGVDVMIVSMGALCDQAIRDTLDAAAAQGHGRLLTVSGAIGGLDALEAARSAGIDSVDYIGRKPPHAWAGTPAEAICDLGHLAGPTVVFEGSAGESSRLYPRNANVTAAVALAGIGFDRTSVRLVADPTIDRNVHELEVVGAFGSFRIHLQNNPLPENPKTSWLAVLSIEAELQRYFRTRSG